MAGHSFLNVKKDSQTMAKNDTTIFGNNNNSSIEWNGLNPGTLEHNFFHSFTFNVLCVCELTNHKKKNFTSFIVYCTLKKNHLTNCSFNIFHARFTCSIVNSSSHCVQNTTFAYGIFSLHGINFSIRFIASDSLS